MSEIKKKMDTHSMVLQLTRAMEQALQMLQKNSIHMDLSNEEIARMEKQYQSILNSLELLRAQADDNRNRVYRIFNEKKSQCDQLSQKLPSLYTQLEVLVQRNNEQKSIYEGRKAAYEAYNATYASKREAYEHAQIALDEARRKAEEQNKKLKKWCWVPGYGIYLAFDKLLNDKEIDAEAAKREFYAAEERLHTLSDSIRIAEHDFQASKSDKETVQGTYDEMKKAITKVQGQLHQMKVEMVHWELILSEVNALYNKIKNASLSPDEIIAMQAELIKLQKI